MTRINLILLGESGVGKTALLNRFKTDKFQPPSVCTVPVEFHAKKVQIQGIEVNIFLWDTSGQERFNAIVRSYFRKGEGVLLIYDVTDPATFYKLSKRLQELKETNEDSHILIAGNKNDDTSKKSVNVSMVQNFARDENLEYMEVSALTGENVDKAFDYLVRKVLISKGILSENSNGSSENKKLLDEKEGKEIILLTKSLEDSASKRCTVKGNSSCC